MKKIFSFLARPVVWSTLGLGILLLCLWVICGLLRLDEQAWLVELLVGTPLTLFLLIYWVGRFVAARRLTRDLAKQARKQAVIAGPDAVRDFAALAEEFQRSFGELNDTCRKRGLIGGAAALPWILVMGPPAVGKSTALDRSGLRFISRRMQGIGPTRNCTFWLASDAVFLDTAGRYAMREEDRDEWAAFLQLLQRRRKQSIDAVVLQVGMEELLDRSAADIERSAGKLRERLDELTQILGVQIPIHLLFNKVDLLDGFSEFCADLTADERERAWGFSLDRALGHSSAAHGSLGSLVEERVGELVTSLAARLAGRLLVQPSREGREAVLSFPSQVEALRAPLRRFIEVLVEAHAGSERPRLAAVYLASAVQTGERRLGARHRLATELGLNLPLRPGPAPGTESSSFLRGIFAQVIRHSENAARPSVQRIRKLQRDQRLAVALGMLACLSVCWVLGGRYKADRRWLEQLVAAVQDLRESQGPGELASRATESKIQRELVAQQALLTLLEEKPHGALGRPHRTASDILLRRIDTTWLRPLRAQLQQDLVRASTTQYDKPGADFDRGFQLLKAAHILDGQSCGPVGEEEIRESIGDFLIEKWRTALVPSYHLFDVRDEADPQRPQSPAGQLGRSLQFFFEQEPQVYAQINSLHLDRQLRQKTLDNLRAADAPAAVVFMLRASNANLYTKTSQLRAQYVVDPGIERVFTRSGCARFFDKKAASGRHWWKCVLNVEEPKDPINLEDEYRRRYLEAWNGWLMELGPRPALKEKEGSGGKDGKGEALTRAGEALDALLRQPRPELTQVVELSGIGREDSIVPKSLRRVRQTGCTGWVRKQAVRANKELRDLDTPEACKQALAAFDPFVRLTAKPTKDGDEEEPGPSGADLFRKYLAAAAALRTALYNINSVAGANRGKQALTLVSQTMNGAGELWAVDEARRSLISDLGGRMSGASIKIPESGLHQILLQVERDAWTALLPVAAKAIDDRWQQEVFEPWSLVRAKHKRYTAQDPERVKDTVDFLKTVKDFSKQALSPFYQNGDPSRCVPADMKPPFAEALPLHRPSCEMLQKFIRIAEVTDPNKAPGSAGGAAKRPPISVDVVMPPPCRGYNARVVKLDDSEMLHICSVNTAKCEHEKSVNRRPSLAASWGENKSFTQYFQGSDYSLFIKNPGSLDENRLTFVLPTAEAPGQCPGIKVIFELQPAQGGGGAPSKPDNAWKEIALPASLLR